MNRVVMLALLAGCAESRTTPETCVGADCAVRVHEPGILDRSSDEFHGRLLARHDWQFSLCQGCHGEDFAGGISGKSCLTCHDSGPTTCETCHGPDGLEPLTTGAHPAHVAAQVDCAECHVVPASWDAPGHIIDDAPPAEVTFGARANVTPPAAQRSGPPTWDGRACSNVYCHGDVTPSYGGADTKPHWATTAPAFTCDQCHGAPPPDHVHRRVDCVSCHPFTPSEHSNGVIDIL